MACGQRGDAHGVHVVFNGLAGALFGGLKERAHVHVKSQVSKGGGHHFGAAVVAVLAELADHHAGAAALGVGEGGNVGLEGVPIFHGVALRSVVGGGVHAADLVRVGAVAAEGLFQRIADLAHRGAQADGLDAQVQQVVGLAILTLGIRMTRCKSDSSQRSIHGRSVAFGPDFQQTGNLPVTHRHVVDVARLNRIFRLELVFVDAHNHVLPAVDAGLLVSGGGFNLELGPAAVHGLDHATHSLHFFDDGPRRVRHVLRQLLHHVAAGPRVNHVGDVGLFLNDELGVAGNACRKLGGQRNGFVKAVGVQALRAAKHRSHGLDGGAHHVVVGVLLRQAPAARLAVGAQHQALRVLRVKALHDAAPQQARRAHLGHF